APPTSTLFPYTTLFRSRDLPREHRRERIHERGENQGPLGAEELVDADGRQAADEPADDRDDRETRVRGDELALAADERGHERARSEEHTSELQSLAYLV